MAKAKKFNIQNFVEEATESVLVADDQRRKENEDRRREEEMRRQAEETRRREEEERQKQEEEIRLRQEEERKRQEEAARLQAEEERRREEELLAKQREEEERLHAEEERRNAERTQAAQQAPAYIPMDTQSRVGESSLSVMEEPKKSKRGRKKSLRTIERVNGKIVFLEKGMDVDLARLSTFERFDKQDIIRTALYQWLKLHFDGMMLDNDGRREVIEYIQRTTTFEEY